jgi:hypothetical protein
VRSSSPVTCQAGVDVPSSLTSLDELAVILADPAVLYRSLWYFQDEVDARKLSNTLAQEKILRLFLAEWSYQLSSDAQLSHIVAARVQALSYRFNTPSEPGFKDQTICGGYRSRFHACGGSWHRIHDCGFNLSQII